MDKEDTTSYIEYSNKNLDNDSLELDFFTSKQYFENWCEKIRDLISQGVSQFLIVGSREENLKKFTDYPNDRMFDAFARIFNVKGGTTATTIRDWYLIRCL